MQSAATERKSDFFPNPKCSQKLKSSSMELYDWEQRIFKAQKVLIIQRSNFRQVIDHCKRQMTNGVGLGIFTIAKNIGGDLEGK